MIRAQAVDARLPLAAVAAFLFWFATEVGNIATFLFFRASPVTGTLANGLLVAGLLYLVATLLPLGRARRATIATPAGLVLPTLFLAWTGLSLGWTQAGSGAVAAAYWAVSAGTALGVVLLYRTGDGEQIAVKSLQGLVCGGLVIAVAALALAGTTAEHRLGDEAFLHPNSLGQHMAIAALAALHLAFHGRQGQAPDRRWGAAALVLTFTLLCSLSKVSMGGFLIAAGVYLARGSLAAGQARLALGVVAVAVACALPGLTGYLDTYVHDQQGGEALETLTGRTAIWQQTWAMIQQHPWLGHGYLAFRDVGPQIAEVRLVHAHNEAIHLWFSYGLVGLGLAVAAMLGFHARVRQARRDPALAGPAALAEALWVYALVRGLTEASVSDLVFSLPLMALMLGWLGLRRAKS